MIKIIERLFIMKVLCPEIIHKKIDSFLTYIGIIDKKLSRKSEFINITEILKNIEITDYEVK
jgi:hypothetical protein